MSSMLDEEWKLREEEQARRDEVWPPQCDDEYECEDEYEEEDEAW